MSQSRAQTTLMVLLIVFHYQDQSITWDRLQHPTRWIILSLIQFSFVFFAAYSFYYLSLSQLLSDSVWMWLSKCACTCASSVLCVTLQCRNGGWRKCK